jgi:hypothetical protein
MYLNAGEKLWLLLLKMTGVTEIEQTLTVAGERHVIRLVRTF